MNLIDQQLFNLYCGPILRKAENFDEYALKALSKSIKLEEPLYHGLLDVLADLHYQWSLDAFTAGLHLGLSLYNNIRGGGPQQAQ